MTKNPITRLPKFIIWYICGLLMFALLAPLFSLFIFATLLFIFPFFVLLFIPGTGSREYRQVPYTQRLIDLSEIIIKSTGMIAAIAILRALTVMLYHNVPSVLMVIDAPFIIIADYFDVSSLAVIDYFTGIAGIIVFTILILEDTLWRIAQHRNTTTMPFSRTHSVAIGLVKLQGIAKPLEKFRNQPAILEHGQSLDPNEKDIEVRHPFYLEDDTGRI